VLGTPPSGRSPKASEDKTSGAMKPMSRASAKMACLVGPRVGRRRQAKTGRHKRLDEEWSVGPHGLRRSGRRGPPGVVGPSELYRTYAGIWKSRVRSGIFQEYDHCKGAKE